MSDFDDQIEHFRKLRNQWREDLKEYVNGVRAEARITDGGERVDTTKERIDKLMFQIDRCNILIAAYEAHNKEPD